MQSILDNLCRCFGTGTPTTANTTTFVATSAREQQTPSFPGYETCTSGTPAAPSSLDATTPDMKRRTRSLSLQDKQWDNLFSQQPKLRPNNNNDSNICTNDGVEQAVAVARAKLVAAQTRPKRKRSRTSRDDIFRSKKSTPLRGNSQQHPINRFLSSHAVLANSLCFATPVKDSRDSEPPEVPLHNHSLLSDANTHHTADDTVSSTVYYENTKLAGMQQKNPPMPLFDSFQVNDGAEIHRIVATHSHSSQRLMGMYRREMAEWQENMVELSDEEEEDDEEDDIEEVPPMVHSSSDSTRSSKQLI